MARCPARLWLGQRHGLARLEESSAATQIERRRWQGSAAAGLPGAGSGAYVDPTRRGGIVGGGGGCSLSRSPVFGFGLMDGEFASGGQIQSWWRTSVVRGWRAEIWRGRAGLTSRRWRRLLSHWIWPTALGWADPAGECPRQPAEANSDDDGHQSQQWQSVVTSMCGCVAWGRIYDPASQQCCQGHGWRLQGRLLASLMGGCHRSKYGHWPMPRTGLGRHSESCVPGRRCILPWKRLSIDSLPFV
jgi:hypothetical protein